MVLNDILFWVTMLAVPIFFGLFVSIIVFGEIRKYANKKQRVKKIQKRKTQFKLIKGGKE